MINKPTGGGNSNFFTIYKGKYKITNSDGSENVVMLTKMNILQFTADKTSNAEGLIGAVDEDCRPDSPLRIVCAKDSAARISDTQISVVTDVKATKETLSIDKVSSTDVNAVGAIKQKKKSVSIPSVSVSDKNVVSGVSNSSKQVLTATASSGLTASQYDGLSSSAVLSGISTTKEVVSKTSVNQSDVSFVDSVSSTNIATSKVNVTQSSETVLTSVETEKTTITIPSIPSSPLGVLILNVDGTLVGEPNTLYYLNGLCVNISGNFYKEA